MILNDEEIRIPKEDYYAAIETIRFLYRDEIPGYVILNPVSALIGGIKYDLPGLRDLSESSVEEIQLTDKVVCNLYQFYERLSVTMVKKIEDFVFANLDQMWQCDRWCELTTLKPDLIVKLIKAALSKKTY